MFIIFVCLYLYGKCNSGVCLITSTGNAEETFNWNDLTPDYCYHLIEVFISSLGPLQSLLIFHHNLSLFSPRYIRRNLSSQLLGFISDQPQLLTNDLKPELVLLVLSNYLSFYLINVSFYSNILPRLSAIQHKKFRKT